MIVIQNMDQVMKIMNVPLLFLLDNLIAVAKDLDMDILPQDATSDKKLCWKSFKKLLLCDIVTY